MARSSPPRAGLDWGHDSPQLPADFLWGVATAGHQNEGDNVDSDTWFLENVTPTIFREPSGKAVNGWELWATDLDLAAGMGLNAYRFSVEWARVEPAEGSSRTRRSPTTRRSSTAASPAVWRRS